MLTSLNRNNTNMDKISDSIISKIIINDAIIFNNSHNRTDDMTSTEDNNGNTELGSKDAITEKTSEYTTTQNSGGNASIEGDSDDRTTERNTGRENNAVTNSESYGSSRDTTVKATTIPVEECILDKDGKPAIQPCWVWG